MITDIPVIRDERVAILNSEKTLGKTLKMLVPGLLGIKFKMAARDCGWREAESEKTSKMESAASAEVVAAQVPFYDACCLLEKIADTSGTEKKKKILSTFVCSWRDAHRKLHKDSSKTVE